MPYSNVIINGSFTLGNTGWSGTDLETNFNETAYLGNGSTNKVAELDGRRGFVTQMQQTVTLTDEHTTDLTFRTALRTASLGNAGREGFRVDVLDSNGVVITTQSFFPTSTAWVNQTMPVTFPAGGTYTIRLTELGPDDSLGAIVDDVSLLACFTTGTLIATNKGKRPVETLAVGDLVWTKDAGMQPLRWLGQRSVSVAEQEKDESLRPVVFAPGSLGAGLPARRMALSRQHRICMSGWQVEMHFGEPEVLVPAMALINGRSIRAAEPQAPVTYVHFLLDRHQIVRSDGVLSESFFPGAMALNGLETAARTELLNLFPELSLPATVRLQTVRPALRGSQAAVLAA